MMTSARKINVFIVFTCFFVLAQVCLLQAKPDVSEYNGAYSDDLVWSGTVAMVGDVLILAEGSLTIHAGTVVNVIPAEGTKIDPEYLSSQTELLVRGTLDILGTKESPVRFVVHGETDAGEIAWSGITLDHAKPSRLMNAELDRADIAIRCVKSSPLIEGNHISASRYGIVAQQQSHPKILDNVLTDGEAGIFCWNGSNPYLLGNQIVGHDEEAIFVDLGSRPWLDRNTVSNNAIGLALYAKDLPFDNLAVTENIENLRYLGQQGQGGTE